MVALCIYKAHSHIWRIFSWKQIPPVSMELLWKCASDESEDGVSFFKNSRMAFFARTVPILPHLCSSKGLSLSLTSFLSLSVVTAPFPLEMFDELQPAGWQLSLYFPCSSGECSSCSELMWWMNVDAICSSAVGISLLGCSGGGDSTAWMKHKSKMSLMLTPFICYFSLSFILTNQMGAWTKAWNGSYIHAHSCTSVKDPLLLPTSPEMEQELLEIGTKWRRFETKSIKIGLLREALKGRWYFEGLWNQSNVRVSMGERGSLFISS